MRSRNLTILLIGLALLLWAAPAQSAEQKGLIGHWRAKSGLEVRIKKCPADRLCGVLLKVPEHLAQHYSMDQPVIIKAGPSDSNKYRGKLLAPSGKWVDAVFIIDKTFTVHMTSHHPGDKKVQWLRVIKLKLPNPAAVDLRSDPRKDPALR